MTTNQIAAARQLEEKRHNLATESVGTGNLSESVRHNLAVEQNALGQLAETTRHNVASEGLSSRTLAESERHNRQSEVESARHNIAGEEISSRATAESERHNRQGEVQASVVAEESARHNVAQENISQGNLDALVQHYTNQDSVATWKNVIDADLATWKQQYEQAQLELQTGHFANETLNTVMNIINNMLRSFTSVSGVLGALK